MYMKYVRAIAILQIKLVFLYKNISSGNHNAVRQLFCKWLKYKAELMMEVGIVKAASLHLLFVYFIVHRSGIN